MVNYSNGISKTIGWIVYWYWKHIAWQKEIIGAMVAGTKAEAVIAVIEKNSA